MCLVGVWGYNSVMNPVNVVFLITEFFAVVNAFGRATNGVRRRDIIKFGSVGWMVMLFVSFALSFTSMGLMIFTALIESFIVYAVFYFLFRKVIFRNIWRE